jgi:transglutaminase-like putative cysteine protease
MTIQVALHHRTVYRFERPVRVHPHTVRLRPAPHARTPIPSYSLTVLPRPHFVNWQQDPFGNYLARLVFPEPVAELDLTVDLVADLTVINPFDFFVEEYAQTFPFDYPPALRAELAPYLHPVDESGPGSGPGQEVLSWLDAHPDLLAGEPRIVDFLVGLNRAVHDDVSYTVRLEVGVQTPGLTLQRRIGSCRDSAWLLVSVLRRLGLAARFVSGYLVQLAPDIPAIDGPAGPTADFTDLHAWAEVYVPGAGWIGLDATSGLLAGEGHIPLSATPHPSSAAPVTGSTDVVGVEMEFSNSVTRIREDPRVTRPYTPTQWQAVDRLGHQVDARLFAGDVRLTMGGEPTFVSARDTSTPQWESEADGPQKRALARELAGALFAAWAPGGVVHHGQGKWYPGEPLPRWQIQILWRQDGQPLWADPDLLDDPWSQAADPDEVGDPAPTSRTATATPDDVRRLALGAAARLGVPGRFCLPAYEDGMHRLWREALEPEGDAPPEVDVEPGALHWDSADDGSPAHPTGWVVPVFRDPDGEGWATAVWRTRRRHLFLIPGSSPMGLRLPLDSIAWKPPPDVPDRSPYEPRGDLPEAGEVLAAVGSRRPAAERDIEDSPRHALCVQERDGHLFVFLPPVSHLEHAVELLAAVEEAATEIGVAVVLEGYPPPGTRGCAACR